MNIVDTIVRLRHHEEREVMGSSDGETVHRVTITLPPTANRFVAGHSLRIDISSSNFPRFDVNSNSGGSPRSRDQRVVINGVHVGGVAAARIRIPTLDDQSLERLRLELPSVRPSATDVMGAWNGVSRLD